MVQETSMKRLHSEERTPYNARNRTEQKTLNKNWVKNSHRKEKRPTTKSTPLLRTNSLGKSIKKKVALTREKGTLQHTKQNGRTDNVEEELSEKWPQKIKEKKETLYRKGALHKCWKQTKQKTTQLLRTTAWGKKLEKGSLRKEKEALQHPKQNRTEQHWTRTEWKMTTQKKREEKNSSNTESYNSGLKQKQKNKKLN